MNYLKIKILLYLLLVSCILRGADLNITWKEGKDNRYNHPATLRVIHSSNSKPVASADIFWDKEFLGKTNQQGILSTDILNNTAIKHSLKACYDSKCSDNISYQVVASEFPFPLFISMGEDPSNSMSFTWHTEEKIKNSIVECVKYSDPAGFKSGSVVKAIGISYTQELKDTDKPEGLKFSVTVHKTTVHQLSPDTQYKYRAGDGKYWKEGTFITAATNEEEIKFLFTADSQESGRENYQSNFKAVLNKAFEKHPDIRFIMHGGDMVNRGINNQEWMWFFEAGEKYFRNFPFAPVVGNHETGGVNPVAPQQRSQAYLRFFSNSSNHTANFAEGSAYSFNYGSTHLLCLDVQNLFDAMDVQEKTGEKKYLQSAVEWITNDLNAATSQKKWKIVTMHQPIYGANRDEDDLRKVLAPLFDKCKVDVVITGHDHYYFRSFPLKYDSIRNEGEVVPMDSFGTIYLIGGSTCTKMYVQKFARPYQAVVLSKEIFPGRFPWLRNEVLTEQNYSIFTVKKGALYYQFFDKKGNLKDEFSIKRFP